jgi:hypothetical protein
MCAKLHGAEIFASQFGPMFARREKFAPSLRFQLAVIELVLGKR